jgi:uncharacterized protein (TIGR00290 family)
MLESMKPRCESESRVLLSWSGGKDSALALWTLQRTPGVTVTGLMTTITRQFDRISMHGVRRVLLERQVESLGLPLHRVEIAPGASNEDYERSLARELLTQRELGVRVIAFGDLFLEDVRAYRERLLARYGLSGLYPLWGRDTRALMREFIARGFEAVVVCLDPAKLPAEFAGRTIDQQFLDDLPPGVDPCGENGEFHSFVYAGPTFAFPIEFTRGETVTRDGFCFCDLLPRDRRVPQPLRDDDFYYEAGRMVFTASYHLRRGFCCGSGCRHCPYRSTVA